MSVTGNTHITLNITCKIKELEFRTYLVLDVIYSTLKVIKSCLFLFRMILCIPLMSVFRIINKQTFLYKNRYIVVMLVDENKYVKGISSIIDSAKQKNPNDPFITFGRSRTPLPPPPPPPPPPPQRPAVLNFAGFRERLSESPARAYNGKAIGRARN